MPRARYDRHALKPLELALKCAWFDPDDSRPDDRHTELIVAANCFFSGYDNKLTFDFSRLTLEQVRADSLVDYRVRGQWDISF